ncbi:hypothetical protein [Spiroplasma endosymbiont of 'Nebria riversi']|uniref:hypothetical protein n=1 Tax=Spiroplasma endosymbiont of 'Nebria riversi' TaxID=2792084 RepID=UPI001C04BFB5|nr:hypothetical protein [Spiroplasma endosymbiont of 'Nebria riversi']
MEQSFIKREKRATNPGHCSESYELKFASLLNITLVVDSGAYFYLSKFDIELPNDVKNQNKNYPNRLPFFMDSQAFLSIKDFFQKYGAFQSMGSKKIYTIPKVVDVVIKLRNLIKSLFLNFFLGTNAPFTRKRSRATITYWDN